MQSQQHLITDTTNSGSVGNQGDTSRFSYTSNSFHNPAADVGQFEDKKVHLRKRKPKSLMESVILIQQAFKTFLVRKREREMLVHTPRHLSKPEEQSPDHFNGLSKVTAKHGSSHMGDKTLESDLHDEII